MNDLTGATLTPLPKYHCLDGLFLAALLSFSPRFRLAGSSIVSWLGTGTQNIKNSLAKRMQRAFKTIEALAKCHLTLITAQVLLIWQSKWSFNLPIGIQYSQYFVIQSTHQ